MALKRRSPGLVILFSIITFGIYNLYWLVATTNEIEATLQEKDGSVSGGGKTILLTIITCGIYMYYWYFKQGQRISQLGKEADITISDNSVIYLLLAIFGLTIVSAVLIQSDLNRVVDAKNN